MVKSSGHLAVAVVVEWDDAIEMNPRKKEKKKKRNVDIDISRSGGLRFMTNKVYLHVGVVSNRFSSDNTCYWTVVCVLMLYRNGDGNYFKLGQ